MSFLWHAPLFARAARASSTLAAASASVVSSAALPPSVFAPAAPRSKGKNTFKRASEVMLAVRRDAVARMDVKMAGFRPPLPPFNVGDAVKVEYAQELAETDTVPVYGTVMAKYNAGLDDKFTIINVRGFPSL